MAITAFQGAHRFLSNFWDAPVVLDGFTYPSVEHAYQAAKTNSAEERARIAATKSPGSAKRLGRLVTLRPDWEHVKLDIMLDLLRQKFQVPILRRWLIATGDAELIEGNYWNDTFWGVCNGRGQNHLGKLLMRVRDEAKPC